MPEIRIKTINNREMRFNYEAGETIRSLKLNIETKEGVSLDQFKLIFNGLQLEETKKISDYKIEPGHTIIMVSVLRGG